LYIQRFDLNSSDTLGGHHHYYQGTYSWAKLPVVVLVDICYTNLPLLNRLVNARNELAVDSK
jgi:hypothetical protein